MNEWNLRDSLLIATHRWHWILASLLGGALVGALAAFIWPSPFRASTEMLVGLNPYRALEDHYVAAFAQTEFRNADDYKYWQMQHLNALALSDEYLGETLALLRQKDENWQKIEVGDLREMLAAYWRNAGEWRLVVESSDQRQVAQAAQTWREVILDKAGYAISNSQELFRLELELRSITASQLESSTRMSLIEDLGTALRTWQNDLSHMAPSRPLGVSQRSQLWSIAAQAAGNDQGWRMLLEDVPPPQSDAEDYLPWVESLTNAIDAEAGSLRMRLKTLEAERTRVFEQWQRMFGEGQGLAATLQIESPSDSAPEIDQVRPTALAVLVGGALGFLLYSATVLVEISRHGPR